MSPGHDARGRKSTSPASPTRGDVRQATRGKGSCLGKEPPHRVMPTWPSRIMNSFFLTSTIVQGCFHYLEPIKILLSLKESAKTFLRTGCRNMAFRLKTCFVLICHLTTNRIAEEQKQDGQVKASCCFAHTLLYP